MPYAVALAHKFSKQATPEASATISSTFPAAREATGFLDTVRDQLSDLGFKKGNCVALVSSCRDEASRILDVTIAEQYGLIFNLHGLAGVPSGGVLAVKAGCSHSPIDEDGKERYVFFGITHIGVDENGTLGKMRRKGRTPPSGACGALHFLAREIANKTDGGSVPTEDDAEVFFLRKKVEAKGPEGEIVSVTNATVEVMNDTIEDLIGKSVDASRADYAVVTGIQIHTGVNVYNESFSYEKVAEYFVPGKAYAVVNGERKELSL